MSPLLLVLVTSAFLALLGIVYSRLPESTQSRLRGFGAAALAAAFAAGIVQEFLRDCPRPPMLTIYTAFLAAISFTWLFATSWQRQRDDERWRQMVADDQEQRERRQRRAP